MSSAIWLPGQGVVDFQARRVNTAVNEYDENLLFSRHPQTNQWCVFRKIPSDTPTLEGYGTEIAGQRVVPIFGFRDVPHPEDAIKRLYNADAVRRGNELLDEMNRENEALKAPKRQAAEDAAAIAAEGFEWGFRQMGKGNRAVVALNEQKRERMGGWS